MRPGRPWGAAQLRACLSVLLLAAAAAASPASAQGPDHRAVGEPTARQDLENAISAARGRRASGITAIAIGGAAILVGIVVSAVESVDQQEEDEMAHYRNGDYDYTSDKMDYTGVAVGMAVGVPLIVGGSLSLASASRDIRRLSRQRTRLSYAPQTDTAKLVWSYAF